MTWAVLVSMLACGRGSPPGSASPERAARPDPLARGWALKAAVSEGRGDVEEAERAHLWVDRLDPGPWADVHRGEFWLRQGRVDEARHAFEEALSTRPGMPEASLGLGLVLVGSDPDSARVLLEPLVPLFPCRVAMDGPEGLRGPAEEACRAR